MLNIGFRQYFEGAEFAGVGKNSLILTNFLMTEKARKHNLGRIIS